MEPASRRVCPGCQSVMGRVFAQAVELDFCQFCGGLWFDRGEVVAVTGQPESVERGDRLLFSHAGEKSSLSPFRRCPDCAVAMEQGSLRGCAVERCVRCQGTYVPPDTLARLAGHEVRLLPLPDASRRAESLDFLCAGCHERFPLGEAVTTAHGLACVRCSGAVEEVGPSGTAAPDWGQLQLSGPYSQEAQDPAARMRPWIEGIATVLSFFF